jgi:hypothetical protein
LSYRACSRSACLAFGHAKPTSRRSGTLPLVTCARAYVAAAAVAGLGIVMLVHGDDSAEEQKAGRLGRTEVRSSLSASASLSTSSRSASASAGSASRSRGHHRDHQRCTDCQPTGPGSGQPHQRPIQGTCRETCRHRAHPRPPNATPANRRAGCWSSLLVPDPPTFVLFDACAIERAVGDGASHVRWR